MADPDPRLLAEISTGMSMVVLAIEKVTREDMRAELRAGMLALAEQYHDGFGPYLDKEDVLAILEGDGR